MKHFIAMLILTFFTSSMAVTKDLPPNTAKIVYVHAGPEVIRTQLMRSPVPYAGFSQSDLHDALASN